MSRTRMFRDDQPEAPSPRTTIVGGRPPEDRPDLPPVPTGIQTLLRLAAADPDFRRVLLQRRAEVAPAAGVELTRSEEAILRVVPAEQLERMMEALPPPPTGRREFLRHAAASAAAVVLGLGVVSELLSCQHQPTRSEPAPGTGTPVEPAPPRIEVREMEAEGGAAPHEPPPRPLVREMEGDGGAAPDLPPPRPVDGGVPEEAPVRPEVSPMQTRGGIAPEQPPPPRPQPTRGIRPDFPRPELDPGKDTTR